MKSPVSLFGCFALLSGAVLAQEAPPTRDVTFATVDGTELKLDLFLPKGVENPPLVMFIHGGGWKNGSYKTNRLQWLPQHGFAVASVGYRLTDKASFPAQIHDCKGALRWLRAHAETYGYDASKVAVAGTSAGGHLAALMGTSGGVEDLEGTVGGNPEESSTVQAVVDFYGPSDFLLRLKENPAKSEPADSSVALLMGGPVSQNLGTARLASPVTHVSEDDPPLMILHGDKDKVVFISQSERLNSVYKEAGLDVTYIRLEGAGHGGPVFFDQDRQKMIVDFLILHLH